MATFQYITNSRNIRTKLIRTCSNSDCTDFIQLQCTIRKIPCCGCEKYRKLIFLIKKNERKIKILCHQCFKLHQDNSSNLNQTKINFETAQKIYESDGDIKVIFMTAKIDQFKSWIYSHPINLSNKPVFEFGRPELPTKWTREIHWYFPDDLQEKVFVIMVGFQRLVKKGIYIDKHIIARIISDSVFVQ